MTLNKPPINTLADTIAVKGWFNDVYKELNSGILVPGGGVATAPVFPSRRNLLVNGDFMINQRVPTPNTNMNSTGAGTQWTVDRWAITAPANQQQVTQALMFGVSQFPISGLGRTFAQISSTAGNTGTGTMYFAQAIESKIIQEIAGLPVTLSFWATAGSAFGTTYWANQTFNGATGIIMAVMQTGTGVDEGTFAAYTGSTFLPSCGFTPTPYWQFYSVTGTIPANARELKVYFQMVKTSAAYNSNAWFGIADVQLEVGTQATAFDKIDFDESLIECQRFYEKSFDYAVAPAQNTGNTNGAIGYCVPAHTVAANASVHVAFKVRKAKVPAITFYCPKAVTTNWWNETQNVTAGGSGTADIGEYGAIFTETQITGEAIGNLIDIHYTASADI